MIHTRKSKAIGLFSGSLDSILAAKMLAEQGVAIVALNFKLPFPVPGRVPSDEYLQTMADLIGASLISIQADESYLELIRNPEFGYIREMAPCIDCMGWMLKKARELMKEIKADFVFTGEVLGQQPFSQNKRSLKLLERISGLGSRLVRPLSAKILEPTLPELSGLIRRERLLDFHGRSRHQQMRLAREFGVVDYPIPGAGCLLTDSNFAARCRDAVTYQELTWGEIEWLKYGRHFRLKSGARVIIGRNEKENKVLEDLARNNGLLFKPVEIQGPVAVLKTKKVTKKDMELAARMCSRYCDNPKGKAVKILSGEKVFSCKPIKDEDLAEWRIVGGKDKGGGADKNKKNKNNGKELK